MARGVKLCYTYINKNGEKKIVYARNESEAHRLAGTKVERVQYSKNDSGLKNISAKGE